MFRDRGIVHNYMKLANYFAASNPTVSFTFIQQWIVRFQFTMHIQTQLIKLHRIMYKKNNIFSKFARPQPYIDL